MAVDVESTPAFRTDVPKRLVAMPTNPPWVPTPDGQRLLGHGSPAHVQEPITVVLNWDSGLRR